MSDKLKLKRITAAEGATYVAHSQIPQGESLEDEVFPDLFDNVMDFQASPKVLRTANVGYLYINVRTAFKNLIKAYGEAMRYLIFDL